MMRHEQVDVLCLQEFLDDGEFPADSIGALFSRRMPYFVSEGNGAVASRYPILDCKYVRFPDTSNDYLRADLLVEGDTLRIFSVHLQTSGIAQVAPPLPEGLQPGSPGRFDARRRGPQQPDSCRAGA